MYTDDKNAQVVLALLKKFGIRKIVISPGMTNVPISRSVQIDPFFEVYSVVDERSAAYFATGLAYASDEPVAISCTGATASRNYLPGLTEAYYRNLPVIALTSQHHSPDYSDFVPQLTDRTVSQNDIKRYSAMLPVVKDKEDLRKCVFQVNKALHLATVKGDGPVHINIPVTPSFKFNTKQLPDITKIDYFNTETMEPRKLAKELFGKKVGIFVGSHRQFSKETIAAMNSFVQKTGAAVFYDHTSSYTGKNRVLTAQIADLLKTTKLPDIMIDMGAISGDYSAPLLCKGVATWRLSEDGEYHNRKGEQELQKVFEMSERFFFDELADAIIGIKAGSYYESLAKDVKKIQVPQMPLSNTYISSKLSKALPKNSMLHMGILNSLRNMDFFEVDRSILLSSNVGGFGIDGPVSTLIGKAMVDKNRLSFGLVGDLAFFYDMNALGIHHVDKNVRILLVNNNNGVEFRLNETIESQWGSDTNKFISAAGHNGSAKAWAEARGLIYLSADTKESYDKQLADFCSKDINHYDTPVLFEVFTESEDEQLAIKTLRSVNQPIIKAQKASGLSAVKQAVKVVTPNKVKRVYKKLKGNK